jgi:hypothetical protein
MPKYPKTHANTPFNGTTSIRYDDGYIYNKIVFTVVDGKNLSIRFCQSRAPKKYTLDYYIEDFRSLSALDVINNITRFVITPNLTESDGETMGRHFEDGVLEIWHKLGLSMGFIAGQSRLWRKGSTYKI